MNQDTQVPSELVHLDVAGPVATVTLDSPHNRNALSRRLVTELGERLSAAAADPAVRVVVLRATGKVFCSGADLSEAVGEGMEQGARGMVDLQRLLVALPVPVVVVVQGAVRAGGIGVVAACDVAISAAEATYALTEVKLGLAPAAISLTVVPRLTSRAAAWTCLSGETFDGTEAAAMGLVTRAVPRDSLEETAAAMVESLSTGAAQGLRETKTLLTRDLLTRIDTLGGDVAALSARLFGSDEAREAMTAWLSRPR